MSKRKIPRAMVLVGAACVVVPLLLTRLLERQRSAEKADEFRFPSTELAALDRIVQARFAVVPDNSFGMSRIGPRHDWFRSMTAGESAIIDRLRHTGQEVVFYVAGRNYLEGRPITGAYPAALQGPVYMTQKLPLKVLAVQAKKPLAYGLTHTEAPIFRTARRPSDLPSELQLKQATTKMLKSTSWWDQSSTPDGTTFKAGSWNVVAVPVRASDQKCVRCHMVSWTYSQRGGRAPKLGDPLGIALYVHRRVPVLPASRNPIERYQSTLDSP